MVALGPVTVYEKFVALGGSIEVESGSENGSEDEDSESCAEQ